MMNKYLFPLIAGFFVISMTTVQAQSVQLGECESGSLDQALCGTYKVYENIRKKEGRKISLNIVVLQARDRKENVPPVFYLAGGPGQGAASNASRFNDSWARQHQDLVLIDQRGTGASNPLDCKLTGTDEDLQTYLGPVFAEELFRQCKEELEQKADLKWYTTPVAMSDINKVRQALGYDKITLWGTSGGTRSAMVFLQSYSEYVQSVILNGVVPFSFKNPLYHAQSAQLAIDGLFAECRRSESCRSRYPDLENEFKSLLSRLEEEPVKVTIENPFSETADSQTVELSRSTVAETIRVFMYSSSRISRLPKLINEAYLGDYRTFAETAVRRNRAIRGGLQLGTLLSVTCSEDASRIKEKEIIAHTADTFLGDWRVRSQLQVCAFWPEGYLPGQYKTDLNTKVPALLLSGTFDPVTPPKWAGEAKEYFSNFRHLVVPGGHGVGGSCLESIMSDFAVSGNLSSPDYSCVEEITLPDFE